MSGRLSLPAGATIEAVVMAPPETRLLLASTAGYGFVTRVADLLSKNKNGKAVLKLGGGALPLSPMTVGDLEKDLLVAVSNEGRMLVFPVVDLPSLAKGKGNKIIQIPPARAKTGEEVLSRLMLLPAGGDLVVHSGKRYLTLSPGNLVDYRGERGRRGRKLPRGFQNVDRLEIKEMAQRSLLD